MASDKAFCFYYRENLKLLKKLGCELIKFSPLTDRTLPEGVSGIIIGGGYPELYAEQLSGNQEMLCAVRQAVDSGMPCIAECGGFMYLHSSMEGEDGVSYPMAGVIDGHAYRTEKLVRFGYIELYANKDGKYLKKGECVKGHEFHYWDTTSGGEGCLAVKPGKKRSWSCIHMEGNLFAGYPHIHFYSSPLAAERFRDACREWCSKEKEDGTREDTD